MHLLITVIIKLSTKINQVVLSNTILLFCSKNVVFSYENFNVTYACILLYVISTLICINIPQGDALGQKRLDHHACLLSLTGQVIF